MSFEFLDLDEKETFAASFAKAAAVNTHNFAVRFNHEEAHCATDLDVDCIKSFLEPPKDEGKHTRWLNFWGWGDKQRSAIEAIGEIYEVSPRLIDLLCPKQRPAKSAGDASNFLHTTCPARPQPDPHNADPEKALSEEVSTLHSRLSSPDGILSMPGFSDVVDELWHFCSVDKGRRYIFIGFNSLFAAAISAKTKSDPSKPSGCRIWTSLLLCDDGTVISVFESPDVPNHAAQASIQTVRRNALNVFRHLSRLHESVASHEVLMRVTIRSKSLQSPQNEDVIENSVRESASLLLYYLFDDWASTYALIARRKHPYRDQLEQVRQQMFKSADVELIESLHSLGRQLTILKLMYQSYQLVVRRILTSRQTLISSARRGIGDSFRNDDSDQHSLDDQLRLATAADDSTFLGNNIGGAGVLTASAVVRFERLLDRIQLYALAEVEECISEKESLVFMVSSCEHVICILLPNECLQNFNLVSLKESQAVEKLTRTTILLAKATILFLPVSLMTGYFSIQIGNIQDMYTLKTYWLSFLSVILLSIGSLLALGAANSTVSNKTVYKSLTRTLWDKGKTKHKR